MTLRDDLIKLDGEYCFECSFWKEYKDVRTLEVHHAAIHRSKKYMKYLDNVINTCLLCRDCHSSGIPNSHRWRTEFLHKRISQLGKDVVMEWWMSLPEKLKIHSDNLWIKKELEEK